MIITIDMFRQHKSFSTKRETPMSWRFTNISYNIYTYMYVYNGISSCVI